MIFLMYFSYYLVIVIANAVLELRIINSYNVCLYRQATPSVDRLSVSILLLIPNLILAITTNFFDFQCWRLIQELKNNGNSYSDQIPFRVTLINTVFTLTLWCICMILVDDLVYELSPIAKYLLTTIPIGLANIVRMPFIVKFAFRVNEINQHQLDANQQREQNRQLEIEEAIKRRQECLQASNSGNEIFVISNEGTFSGFVCFINLKGPEHLYFFSRSRSMENATSAL